MTSSKAALLVLNGRPSTSANKESDIKRRRSIQLQLRLDEIHGSRYYEFHLSAANIQGIVRARLVNLDACGIWPVMLLDGDSDYLFVAPEECLLIRALCEACGSSHFTAGQPIACFDCGRPADLEVGAGHD